MARSAGDLGLLLSAMAGPDVADGASLAGPPPSPLYPTLPSAGAAPLSGRRLGLPDNAAAGLAVPIAQVFTRAVDELRALGATIVPVAVPESSSAGFTVSSLGASAVDAGIYHEQFYPAKAASYSPVTAALIDAVIAVSNTMPAAAYVNSQRDRLGYMHQWNAVFADNRLDAVLKPGANVDGADRSGVSAQSGVTGDFIWADIAGLPVLAMPIGRSAATGMPFGIQLGGAAHSEATLLQIAIDYQAHFAYHEAVPPGLA
jgi:aspartyl-tRNA(Asn)/glutamyl-tRNA(Gln) amidotransferase subunit A